MNVRTSTNLPKRLTGGMHDSIIDGEIVADIPDKAVYVADETELANFADYPAGTLAIQYGFGALWQLKPDKTWVSV